MGQPLENEGFGQDPLLLLVFTPLALSISHYLVPMQESDAFVLDAGLIILPAVQNKVLDLSCVHDTLLLLHL